MGTDEGPVVDLGTLLEAVENAPPVAAAEVVGERLAEMFGATEVSLLVADLGGRQLARLARRWGSGEGRREQGEESAERVSLKGTPHGRALAEQEVQVEEGEDGTAVYAPVTNRGEAIGVLELVLPGRPSEQTLQSVALVSHLLAYIVIANGRFTDLYEWGQRSAPLTLPAEIQRRLLPRAYTCEAGQATIAGWLEPAADNAGDTFDFSLERDLLHLSMTDAMGHELDAALLATTVVGALRNARRAGCSLEEQAAQAADALAGRADLAGGFATGQVVRIDLDSGDASVINAGHPLPLRLRGGEVEQVPLRPDPPFGAVPDTYTYRAQRLSLEPGDRLFFLTDGVLERNARSLDAAEIVRATAADHPRDAIQKLMHALRDATGGELHDDATAMCVEWHGPGRDARHTSEGADR